MTLRAPLEETLRSIQNLCKGGVNMSEATQEVEDRAILVGDDFGGEGKDEQDDAYGLDDAARLHRSGHRSRSRSRRLRMA